MRAVCTQEDLDSVTGPIVCKFGATWCGPCRDLEPKFEELEREFGHVCTFVTVDVDQAEALCAQHQVKQIPYVKIMQANAEHMSRVNPPLDDVRHVLCSLQDSTAIAA